MIVECYSDGLGGARRFLFEDPNYQVLVLQITNGGDGAEDPVIDCLVAKT